VPRKLKVYGITEYVSANEPAENGNRQARCVVAAPNLSEAAAALDVTTGYLRTYGCETGNSGEIETAMSSPGTVFWQSRDGRWNELAADRPRKRKKETQ
jgi:hypothetical protein